MTSIHNASSSSLNVCPASLYSIARFLNTTSYAIPLLYYLLSVLYSKMTIVCYATFCLNVFGKILTKLLKKGIMVE
jgi:hypothetical protein